MASMLAAHQWDVHVFAGCAETPGSYRSEGYNLHLTQCENGNDFRYKVVKSFSEEHAIAPFNLIESPEINGNAWEVKKKYPTIPLIVRLHAPDYLVEKLKKKYIPFFAKIRFVMGSIRRLKFNLGYWSPYDKTTDQDYQFIKLADGITAPSNIMKDWVVKNWQIDALAITVIPNPFSPAAAFLNIPIQENNLFKRIVFFGRLNVLKGLVNATKAMKIILIQNPAWHFRVIGDDGPGPYNTITMRAWMKQELKDVEGRVEFLDGQPYEELPAAIVDAEIVLLPSLFESFSYTCAEAMAAGKAVIGSNNAGMADLIVHNKSGLLVDPYNCIAVKIELQKLIGDVSFRVQLSKQARKSVIEKQDANITVDHFIKYYRTLIVANI